MPPPSGAVISAVAKAKMKAKAKPKANTQAMAQAQLALRLREQDVEQAEAQVSSSLERLVITPFSRRCTNIYKFSTGLLRDVEGLYKVSSRPFKGFYRGF